MIIIDSTDFGSASRTNFFTQTPFPFTYPPTYNLAYDHKCSLSCGLVQDANKVDGDGAENTITTNPNFSAVSTNQIELVTQTNGNYQLKIKTHDPAGFEIKGLYIVCDAKRNGVAVAGETGYTTNAYGIADVFNSQKRYMGPLHIK